MDVVFSPQALEDYQYWQATNRKVVWRINRLIDDITQGDDPSKGIGKPEKLLPIPAWSRRITDEHRLVYRIIGGELKILQARYHYESPIPLRRLVVDPFPT